MESNVKKIKENPLKQDILDFVKGFSKKYGQGPTEQEIFEGLYLYQNERIDASFFLEKMVDKGILFFKDNVYLTKIEQEKEPAESVVVSISDFKKPVQAQTPEDFVNLILLQVKSAKFSDLGKTANQLENPESIEKNYNWEPTMRELMQLFKK